MSSLLAAVICAVLGILITDVAVPFVMKRLGFEAGGIVSLLGTDGGGFSFAGYIILTIVGATGGIVPTVKEYFFG